MDWLVRVSCGFVLLATLPAQTQFVVRTPVAVGSLGQDAVAVDVDLDGDLDLCGWGSIQSLPTARLLRNGGFGQFSDVSGTALPAPLLGAFPGRILALDVDADGDPDLLPWSNTALRLWRNNGSGTFTNTSLADAGGYSDAVPVDVDSDGDLDVAVVGNWLTGVPNRLFRNQGGGLVATLLPSSASAVAIHAIDLEGDGDQDLLLGGFTFVVLANAGGLVDVTSQWVGGLAIGPMSDIAVGDVDGDGDSDVALAASGSIVVLRNTGASFTLAASIPSGGSTSFQMQLVDVDEDGDLDLWWGSQANSIRLALGNGLGAFVPAPSRHPQLGAQNPRLMAADFDGDGDVDLLVSEFGGAATMVVNRQRDLVAGQPVRGQTWTLQVASQPGYATLDHTAVLGIGLSGLAQPLAVPGLGRLGIDLAGPFVLTPAIVPASVGTAPFAFPVPNDPALAGQALYVQALLDQAPWPTKLTACLRVVVQ